MEPFTYTRKYYNLAVNTTFSRWLCCVSAISSRQPCDQHYESGRGHGTVCSSRLLSKVVCNYLPLPVARSPQCSAQVDENEGIADNDDDDNRSGGEDGV